MDLLKTFWERVSDELDKKRISQNELSQVVGVDYRTFWRWRTNQVNIKLEKALRVAQGFNVSLWYLLGVIDEPSVSNDFYEVLKKDFPDLEKMRLNLFETYTLIEYATKEKFAKDIMGYERSKRQ